MKSILFLIFFLVFSLSAQNYQDNKDGTVTDLKTKLVWQKCSIGQSLPDCNGYPRRLHFKDAQAECSKLNLAKRPWRVPTLEELKTLIEKNRPIAPKINPVFTSTPYNSLYWTSTSDTKNRDHVFAINFYEGRELPYPIGTDAPFVRCVSGP